MTMTTASLLGRAHDDVVDQPDPCRPATAARLPPRSTRRKSSPSTTRSRPAQPERGALLRREARTPRTSPSGARSATPAGAKRQGLAPKPKPRRSPEQVELKPLRRKTERLEAELERTKARWRSREQCMRSWSSSPGARSPTRGQSGDRRAAREPRSRHVDQAGARAAGRVQSEVYRGRRPPCLARRHGRHRRTSSPEANASTSSPCCDRRSLAMWRPPTCGPASSTTASTCAASARVPAVGHRRGSTASAVGSAGSSPQEALAGEHPPAGSADLYSAAVRLANRPPGSRRWR